MEIPSRDEAFPIFEPLVPFFDGCMERSWAWWLDFQAREQGWVSPTTRANLVFDRFIDEATQGARSLDGIYVRDARQVRFIDISGNFLVRFHKFSRGHEVCGVPTEQKQLFENQAINFPGMDAPVVVFAGYWLDPLEQSLARKALFCKEGKRVVWEIDLDGAVGGSGDITPIKPPAAPQPPTIKSRTKRTNKEDDKGGS